MKFIVLCFLLLHSLPVSSQSKSVKCEDIAQVVVQKLTGADFMGRQPGTSGDTVTQLFLISSLQKLNIKPLLKKTYLQQFTYKTEEKDIQTANVIGFIDNKAQRNILLLAHFDHLGFNHAKSRSYFQNAVHPGADDNASGVALLLILSHHLQTRNIRTSFHKTSNFIIAFISGHEDGLHGSTQLLQLLQQKNIPVHFCINFDMVGRLNPEFGLLVYNYSHVDLTDPAYNQHGKLKIHLETHPILSDITPFREMNIPSIHITTGMHDDYHRISDTPDKINYAGMCFILDYVLKLLTGISKDLYEIE